MSRLLRLLARYLDYRQRTVWDIGIIPAAVLLIVGATLSWVAYDGYQQAQEAEFRLLEAHARNADAQVSAALGKVERLLNKVAAAWLQGQPSQPQAFAAALRRYDDEMPGLGILLLTDARGRIQVATKAPLVGRNVANEAYFTEQRDPGPLPRMSMSRPDQRLLGTPAVVFSLPIVGADRRFHGVAAATIDFRFFPRVLQAINPDDSASMTVIYNRHGDMLFRRADPEKFFGFNIVNTSTVFQPHAAAATAVTRHVGPSAIDGKPRLFLVRDVGESGLSLVLSRQRDEVLARWQRNVLVYALIFVFTTVVVTALAIVAARRKRQVLAGKAFSDQLIATANVMVVGLDGAGRISIFNQTAERISGYRRDEVLGRNWLELGLLAEDALWVWTMFRQFQRGGELPHTVDFSIRSKLGEERIVSWQNSVIEQPRAAICFGIDVTARRQMEAERERFVAMVSHEFRTPLATIDGAVQHLETHAEHADEATRKRYVKIQKAVDRLISLLDDYLLQERMGQSAQGLELAPVAPAALLQDLRAAAGALSSEHRIVLEDEGLPPAVACDADLMRLALRVLADNAVKYTPPGCEIRLACRRAAEGGVEFLVRDNGPGIAEDELPQLFDKFFRGRAAAAQSGSGIGLHLARSVIVSHGGRLSARNVPEGGAEFRVWLPDAAVRIG
jgi:PAS domain S-box-containing protein